VLGLQLTAQEGKTAYLKAGTSGTRTPSRSQSRRCSVAVLPEEEKVCGGFLSYQARALGDLTIELSVANKYHVFRSWFRSSVLDP